MKPYHCLELEYLPNPSPYAWNMNVQHSYTRLFPILLGTFRSRSKLLATFTSNSKQAASSSSGATQTLKSSDLESNPYYKKYADKIYSLKTSNPEQFQKRMKLLQSMHNMDNSCSTAQTNEKKKPNEDSSVNNSKTTRSDKATASKGLDSILNVEKIDPLSAEEIRDLWIQNYAHKDAVCAVISSDAYVSIKIIASSYPVFVYPIPRHDGYEMFVGQFSDDAFHFTSLFNYQRHQANAPSQLTLKHYTELQERKGIVLMSGLVHDESLSVTDAQLLSYLIQHFYKEHPTMVEDFNKSPNTFDVNDIINAMDGALLTKSGNLKK